MKSKYVFIFLSLLTGCLYGQPKCHIEHLGTEDGLPQHTVMDMLQDRKGFLWFSTWDGLSKFDGYNFYSYKIQHGDDYQMRSNRMDKIYDDKYGYIWTLSYDNEPHRFDPRAEAFMGLRSVKGYEDISTGTEKILPKPSGKVWIIPEKSGCICVVDSTFRLEFYNVVNKKIQGYKVYDVFEDSEWNSWILTDNGLYAFSAKNEMLGSYFVSKAGEEKQKAFHSAIDIGEEIWFGSDEGQVHIYDKKRKRFELLPTQVQSSVNFIQQINNNLVLITTTSEGFFIYDKSLKALSLYNSSSLKGMNNDHILYPYVDRLGNVWFELDCLGVAKFNVATRTMKHYVMPLESLSASVFPPNFFIFEDLFGYLWVHPRGGGFSFYDPLTDELLPFYNEPNSPNWKFSSMMHAAFSDKQGNLWLSTRSHGLEKVIFSAEVFKSMIVDPNIHSSTNNDVRAVFVDNEDRLWVSTKAGRIFVYNSEREKLGYLCADGSIGYGTPVDGFCYSIIQDVDNNIWIGTKGDGVFKLIPSSVQARYQINHYTKSKIKKNEYGLSGNSVYSIFQDRNERIWIGTYDGGINYIDEKDGEVRFINSKNELKQYPVKFGSQVRVISSDKHGNICVGTTLGLLMFSPDFKSPSDIQFKSYTRVSGDNQSLSGNDIYDICTTKKGETFIATFGGGINKISEVDEKGFPLKFKAYTTQRGLPSDVILTVMEDLDGKLWIATEGNLTKFDTEKELFETYSEISRLIDGQNFSEGARFSAKSGVVYVGYSRGVLSINPEKIVDNTYSPYVALTNFSLANEKVPIGNNNSPLSVNIDDLEKLKLNHNQNFFSIEFAALDYVGSKNISYAYKLDGFDKDWVVSQKQRVANYTNLSPGRYTFRVKSTNSDGVWADNEHVLKIEIVPSFWQTPWAYLVYFMLFVALLFVVLRALFMFYRMKDKVVLEQKQTEMKTRFFIDISHEIRTPLTMIVSPIENIVEDKETPSSIKEQLQLVLKNTNRMLRMVNQILDFRKIQKQKLTVRETPIASFVSDVCAGFEKAADYQGIVLSVNNKVKDAKLWIDRDSFEKLLFNLLSNSFKYTPKGGRIEVSLFDKGDTVALQVRDEGRGMTRDVQSKLFTRFASFNKDKSQPSTGIGLSIVKEVADKHSARIQVTSDVSKGSVFTVLFNKGIAHFDDEDAEIVYNSEPVSMEIANEGSGEPELNDKKVVKKHQKQSILIAEDDSDLRAFIKATLLPFYDIFEAENGEIAYEIAQKEYPDFILSDIMMPEVDGLEFLQQIRLNVKTSHIPFILLTAKTDIESRLEGLAYGADDYISKPFSVRYLRARIDNIIKLRLRLFEEAGNRYLLDDSLLVDVEKDKESTITPQDEQFIQKIKEVVERNVDNSNFVVEDLVSEMAMSRTVFFKKLKSLTGLAPIEFIRDVKIRHAAKIMKHEQYTIKEIAFMVGFSDTKYFTQCFKQIFGMTPSEYRNKTKKG